MEMHNLTNKAIGVNRKASKDNLSSLGTASHEQQVVMSSDRHQDTDCKVNTRKPVRLATWNVRTLYQSGKLDNVKQEMERLKINILGISETRWKDCGELKSDTAIITTSQEKLQATKDTG